MQIEAPKNSIRNDSSFLRLYTNAPLHQSNTSHAWTFHGCNLEQVLVLSLCESVNECTSPLVKHLPCVDDQCTQSKTTPCFRALRVGQWVHKSTSQTPPTRGRSMYAIQNKSSFLGLSDLVDECTSPPFKDLPRVADPQLMGVVQTHHITHTKWSGPQVRANPFLDRKVS